MVDNRMDYNIRQGLVHAQNYVFGVFDQTEAHLDSYNPATGEVWARIPDSTPMQVDRAVLAAKSAFPQWSALSYAKRALYMTKIASLLEERLDEFARAESKDQGKPVALARTVDIPRAIENFRAFANSWSHLVETATNMAEFKCINYTTRQPLGVAGLISPWNLPLYLLTFKIAPALMAGNTVVCKPSEMTSVTAWLLAQLFQEAEVPRGVFNLVCGTGPKAGEALVRHPDVRIVSFTGSTMVGERIASIAAPLMKKLSLELGGKNAAIVFADADLKKVIPTLLRSSFLNQGEICLCTSRIFIHESIYEELVEQFVNETKRLSVGDPDDPDTFMGALISRQHLEKVQYYVNAALEDGGRILTGETIRSLKLPPHLSGGYFCQPTIITGLKDDSRCMQEEIFGPVTCLTTFRTEEEVIDRANNVSYGLCASIWSENVGIIHRVASRLEVGYAWANCWLVRDLNVPFGGVKASGVGREGTKHSLETYTEEKTVCLKIG